MAYKEELIGREIEGFSFENEILNNINFGDFYEAEYMDGFIGEIGKIIDYEANDDSYSVIFENGEDWLYPAYLIEEHLIY